MFKVLATSDNRFTDISGGVFNTMPLSDTTYPIPRITEDSLPQVPIQTTVYQPIYRPFLLPNPYLHNPALGNNNMAALPQKNCKYLIHTIKCNISSHFLSFSLTRFHKN